MTLQLQTKATDIDIDPYDWPRCARCRMPVEQFSVTDTGDSITFVARCHGETEVATIPDEVWDTVLGTHVNFGTAFNQGEINDPRKTLDR